MMPMMHIFFGFILSLVTYFIFKLDILSFFILFLSTWFFDVESAIVYSIRYRDVIREKGIKYAYNYAIQKRQMLKKMPKAQRKAMQSKKFLGLFHTIEFVVLMSVILFFLFLYYNISLIYVFCFLAGTVFHILLDIVEGIAAKEKFSIVLFLITYFKEKKKRKIETEEWKRFE